MGINAVRRVFPCTLIYMNLRLAAATLAPYLKALLAQCAKPV